MYRPDKAIEPISNLTSKNRPNTSAPTSANSDKLGVYINDKNFLKFYKKNILTENPVADALGDEGGHVQRYINSYNMVDIAFSSSADGGKINWKPSSKDFGNWRKKEKNGYINVNEHVILRPEDMQIKMSSTQEFESFYDKVMGNQAVQLVDKVAQNARMFNAFRGGGDALDSVYISAYKKVPVLKDISTFTLPSSLKFNFQFGQSGLFSAEEEVVKPILAIAALYMPNRIDVNSVKGSAPSTEYALSVGVRQIAKYLTGSDIESLSANENVSDAWKGGDGFVDSAASALTALQNKIHSAVNSAAQTVLNSGTYKCVIYRIGRLQLPPLIVKDVSIDFDFSSVDEYGFPYKGSISLDGLETTVSANSGLLGIETLDE